MEQEKNVEATHKMLHDFRNWNRDWDLYMKNNPIDADKFVEQLSKQYEVKVK